MRRRPLLRAAAIGGGAYFLGQRRGERLEQEAYGEADQDQRIRDLESQQSRPATTASAGISADSVQKLKELGQLRDQGVLTDDEFATQKERLLAG